MRTDNILKAVLPIVQTVTTLIAANKAMNQTDNSTDNAQGGTMSTTPVIVPTSLPEVKGNNQTVHVDVNITMNVYVSNSDASDFEKVSNKHFDKSFDI